MRISVGLVAAALVVGAAAAAQAAPAAPAAALSGVAASAPVVNVSFRGHPFPYRYTWSRVRACTRYLPVETARGVRWQRTWVCRR